MNTVTSHEYLVITANGPDLVGLVEKFTNRILDAGCNIEASRMAVLGRYIITPAIFDILAHTLPGKGGEVQLTDALQVLADRQPVYAYDFEGTRYDLGDKLGFLKATVEFALRREDLGEAFRAYLTELVPQI